jgi:transposase InsO family protein
MIQSSACQPWHVDPPGLAGEHGGLVGTYTISWDTIELANERRRFGYRRLFVLIRRERKPSGVNRIYRLYREEGLSVHKRKTRRRTVGTRAPIVVEAKANARGSLDFVHDRFACGRGFRVLNIVDDVTRECLAAIPDISISGRRVARELTMLIERR